jgi:hypothetical protein
MKLVSTIIFIDTSIFVSENYMWGRKLNTLSTFSKEGIIQLKITAVTYEEIKKRFVSDLKNTKTHFKQAQRKFNDEGRILKNLPEFKPYYPLPVIDINDAFAKLVVQLDAFIAEHNIEVVDISFSNTQDVFDQYFKKQPPFGEGQKKDEFPDAFMLSIIEGWCKANKTNVHILSTDNDVKTYISPSGAIVPSFDIAELIEAVVAKSEQVKFNFIDTSIIRNLYVIQDYISANYEDNIAYMVYEELLSDAFYEELEYEPADIQKIEIIHHNVTNISDDDAIVEYEVEVTFKMPISYNDLSTGYYDKEDGVWWGVEYVSEANTYKAKLEFTAEYTFDVKEEYFEFEGLDNLKLIEYSEIE